MTERPKNPYRPYDLESGDWFYHEEVIEKIKEILDSPNDKNRIIFLQGNPGSGKTSTLKWLTKNPVCLGKNFIPVYLDLKKYIEKSKDILPSLLPDIIEQINQFEDDIRIPVKHNSPPNTIEKLFLLFEYYLNSETRILFILDELDRFIKKAKLETVSDCISILKEIELSWDKYYLILSGDQRLDNLQESLSIDLLINSSQLIELEKVLKTESLRKRVIEPVKEIFTYKNDAIEKIIWYCGKNFHVHELICYYVFDFMEKKQKTICSIEDVEEAVYLLLEDQRPEFEFFWNETLTLHGKLILSALADEIITQKKGEYYFLNDNIILYTILGNEIKAKLKSFYKFGYITKVESKRFSQYPIGIPLYGKWLKKEHSFQKTIAENLQEISEKLSITELSTVIMQVHSENVTLYNKKDFLELASKWQNLTEGLMNDSSAQFKEKATKFLEFFTEKMNLTLEEKFQKNSNYCIIDIKSLSIGVLEKAFFFIHRRHDVSNKDIANIERTATSIAQEEQGQTKLTLFLTLEKSIQTEELNKKPYLNFIALDENDIKNILISDKLSESFRQIIISRLSLTRLSPYKTNGPARATFYGRSKIINTISSKNTASNSIVGSRKIGKTSLVLKIKDSLPPSTCCIFLDSQVFSSNAKNYNNFIEDFYIKVKDNIESNYCFSDFLSEKNLSKLPEIIKNLSKPHSKVVFIIDEIDELLKFDKKHNFQLLRMFRSLSQQNYCQFIFTGFEELFHGKRDIKNPLYNFCEEFKLPPLAKVDAMDLITKPMENIGIHYENIEAKKKILYYTACHPHLLQFFCKKLVEKVEEKESKRKLRTILEKDVIELFNDEYQQYILDEVYMFNSDLNSIERLILLIIADDLSNQKTASIKAIKDTLHSNKLKISINEIDQHLKNLELRLILKKEKVTRYRFELPHFAQMLKTKIGFDYKDCLIQEIKSFPFIRQIGDKIKSIIKPKQNSAGRRNK